MLWLCARAPRSHKATQHDARSPSPMHFLAPPRAAPPPRTHPRTCTHPHTRTCSIHTLPGSHLTRVRGMDIHAATSTCVGAPEKEEAGPAGAAWSP